MSTLFNVDSRISGSKLLKKKRRRTGIIHVIPVSQFWSILANDSETAVWYKDRTKAGVTSTDQSTKTNPDMISSWDQGEPEGMEANGVPILLGKQYCLLFCFYGPKTALLNHGWVAHDPVKIK